VKTRVQKWGNSLAVRIPRPFAEESNLREDSTVDVSLRNGKLILVAVVEPASSLGELVKKITPRNRYHEIETGGPVGKEVW
jgi:antitoxin MazE